METTSKVSLELSSRINLERPGARVKLSTLGTSHKPTPPSPPPHTHTHKPWQRPRKPSPTQKNIMTKKKMCLRTSPTTLPSIPKMHKNQRHPYYPQRIWVDEISCIIYRDLQILLPLVNSKNISMIWTCFILSKTL